MAYESIEVGMVEALTNDANVYALVGNRIRPMDLPSKIKLPAMTYQRIGGDVSNDLQGTQPPYFARIQITIWDTTYAIPKEVDKKVFDCLIAARGAMGDHTVQCIAADGDAQDMRDTTSEINGQKGFYGSQRDYIVTYR